MLWLNTHARTRKRLSPYIDGRLSPREMAALEAHLAGCEVCRRQLDDLRATISAVGGLADVEAPRSFALSPRMLERRAAVPLASLPPLATGMRLAGAGVALVLAVVLIGDLGSVGSGGGDESGAQQAAEFRMSDGDNNDAAGGGAAPAATGATEEYAIIGTDRASPEDSASSGEAEPCSPAASESRSDAQSGGGGVGGSVTATSGATTTPEPAPIASSAPLPEAVGATADCAPAVADIAPEVESPAAAEALRDGGDEGEVAAPAETAFREEGGVSTLTVLEIILAGALIALVGGIGIEYMLRRRAV